MSFNESACDIHLSALRGGTVLNAICNNDEGSGLTTDFLLDQCLGNNDGHFEWGGTDFSKSARNASISEGPKRKPILHAELLNSSGDYVSTEIDLAPHIANIDGELKFIVTED
ncbi:uncharacterized protein N7482_004790 [Penicillium canariense]|uniref:Cyanovirin-N domain-containing protein n=1 Tax=Penicillium canariense TaxID=189055 RepID=A0A9W9LQF1_9EURO|nr:uncharacterized protein N7482_004790 [Penicillium canariense]KAJ5169196.1 hypothetical protein N7482_004790 [Penicillium canariense]